MSHSVYKSTKEASMPLAYAWLPGIVINGNIKDTFPNCGHASPIMTQWGKLNQFWSNQNQNQ